MIEITYRPEIPSVKITGHAGFAQSGQDLVCAAVSTLTYTLSANVADMGDREMVANAVTQLKPGYSEISCKVIPGWESDVKQIFDAICLGFELLAINFQKNIKYEVVTG